MKATNFNFVLGGRMYVAGLCQPIYPSIYIVKNTTYLYGYSSYPWSETLEGFFIFERYNN